MMSLTVGQFTQVRDSGPLGPLVMKKKSLVYIYRVVHRLPLNSHLLLGMHEAGYVSDSIQRRILPNVKI